MNKFPWIDMTDCETLVIICNPQLLAPTKENIQTESENTLQERISSPYQVGGL